MLSHLSEYLSHRDKSITTISFHSQRGHSEWVKRQFRLVSRINKKILFLFRGNFEKTGFNSGRVFLEMPLPGLMPGLGISRIVLPV